MAAKMDQGLARPVRRDSLNWLSDVSNCSGSYMEQSRGGSRWTARDPRILDCSPIGAEHGGYCVQPLTLGSRLRAEPAAFLKWRPLCRNPGRLPVRSAPRGQARAGYLGGLAVAWLPSTAAAATVRYRSSLFRIRGESPAESASIRA